MPETRTGGNKTAIIIAVLGIAIELIGIALLSSDRITTTVAVPLMGLGMLMAFVPIFLLARRARHRR